MNRRVALAVAVLAVLCGIGIWLYSEKKPPAPTESVAAPATPQEKSAESPAALSTTVTTPVKAAAPGRFDLGLDGAPLPPLPESAPARVKLGVALFAYDGAQGVPGALRSQKAAFELAKLALSGSGGEFAKVVAKGDPGSREDVGWIRRGVLERRVEQAVFLMEKGATSKEPIDTPRGYWVVQRSQ